MSIIDDQSIFIAMKQDGPLRVEDNVIPGKRFSRHSRQWLNSFKQHISVITKYRAVREHIFDLLDITSFDQINGLLDNPEAVERLSKRSYTLLANLYGISGEATEVRSHLKEYALAADNVISYLKQNVLSSYSSHIEISNEIETIHNPIDLLLIIFNNKYHKKARFEAKRKLVLMSLAGSIDQRERETDIENKFANFLNFLNQFVWSPKFKIGELQTAYLFSSHDAEDFACTHVKLLEPQQAMQIDKPGRHEKLTLIKRRHFQLNNQDIPVYVSIRKKNSAAKILKLLRKNEKNPAVAVDDELGLMAVLDSKSDIKKFIQHLTRSALKADSVMVLEDISDTLSGEAYQATSTGSSSKTPMLKFFARLGGMRVEFIIHTNESYLNYRYQRDIAHEEYEVRRLFDSGVADFLFPEDIYSLDMQKIRNQQLAAFRNAIES